ncbi:M48 family metallopeptidase [Psychrobacter frigidicola]|uniref:M48 family metallopeptidase n=1 Tax=Psychrobacter frigidicola TaxID=45611 RepID=A0A5C7A084_9GAMM|nr:SprT family zinc-dependent metalloprotease [Psychrobacter frigidicola]TXD96214.1 M48 family metallopeptidase [Psychrobacter frigidicola]
MNKVSINGKSHTSKEERGVFSYGTDVIHYEVIRKSVSSKAQASNTKPRKVVIKVHPDQRVVATAPIDATDLIIHDAMMKRARWIWQSLQDFAKQKDHVLSKRYVSGETQFYLGRRYVLKVLTDPSILPSVKLNRGKLNVTLGQEVINQRSDIRAAEVKLLIDQWYRNRAEIVFKVALEALLPKASWIKIHPSFRVLVMKKQWGSCSTKGSLILNPHLVKAPKECIDYVILHELCHIAEHNHSEQFWRLLTQVMPNWREVKVKLDGMAEMYLNE